MSGLFPPTPTSIGVPVWVKEEPELTAHGHGAPDKEDPFARLERDPYMKMEVLFAMALEAQKKTAKRRRLDSSAVGPKSSTIAAGFRWKEFPMLEDILNENMKAHFRLEERKTREKVAFFDTLLRTIRTAATRYGCEFDESCTDKVLRSRIRAHYKTVLQTSRKRYNTLKRSGKGFVLKSLIRAIEGSKARPSRILDREPISPIRKRQCIGRRGIDQVEVLPPTPVKTAHGRALHERRDPAPFGVFHGD